MSYMHGIPGNGTKYEKLETKALTKPNWGSWTVCSTAPEAEPTGNQVLWRQYSGTARAASVGIRTS